MTDLPVLLKYAEQFRGLHTNFTYAQKQSPHKFILLYSLRPLQNSPFLNNRSPKQVFGCFCFEYPLILLKYPLNAPLDT